MIGVDGGGTKTEAVLARARTDDQPRGGQDGAQPEIVATSVTGPSNLQRLPMQSSLDAVAAACEGLLEQVPEARDRVQASCLAMAGSGNPLLKAAFERWVEQQPWSGTAHVTHDARAVIAAGNQSDAGIALIAGTGSFAFALDRQGRSAQCGGWGGLLGDEGSAHWIALEGFRRSLRSLDGRGEQTCLVEDLTRWCTDIGPPRWPHHLSLLQPKQIAAAAPVVTRAAQHGDAVASRIVQAAADELATLVVTLARQLFAGESFELACAGGPLCNVPVLGERLLERLADDGFDRVQLQCVKHPAHGAARMAADHDLTFRCSEG